MINGIMVFFSKNELACMIFRLQILWYGFHATIKELDKCSFYAIKEITDFMVWISSDNKRVR